MTQKRLLSGMQPTGRLHLGHLAGVLANWVRMQHEYEMYCCVVDWHSLTTLYDRTEEVAQATREVAADYVAAGLDPAKCAIFVQSHVKEHAELHLLLSMVTPIGWLERVPTYKEKRDNLGLNEESVSYGLLGYPVLMASDILVYRAQAVPVGRDQLPHLELTREIARRFNRLYGDVFPEPAPVIDEFAAVVPGLDGRKMSKSYGNAIYLADEADVVAQKVNQSYTTPTKMRMTDPGDPENCVVCQLRRAYDPMGYVPSWEEDRRGLRGCVQNKRELTEVLNARLEPIRARRRELLSDPVQLDSILRDGAERARSVASDTMSMVRRAMHLA
ncbi:MAG TPA: tryptophan--tRNA ligase [Chthonomonadales bacterium]|nr:tryptophan--tRNA ligase [Chthonomonadales bacterium]